MKELNLITNLHNKTKRNYLERMVNEKIHCMNISKKYDSRYWDSDRKFGYGGYKYIPGRWKPVAKKLIKKFNLTNKSKILDIGCGKAHLLYEIKLILPECKIYGFDISNYAIKNAPKLIKKNLYIYDASKKLNYKDREFDLVISVGCLHNLEINQLKKSIKETQRVGKNQYILVESYRNNKELFNLQCWALTCESFFSRKEWIWLFKEYKYSGYYEFIYFK
jgi:ubiquinone/menaquinone biosynthesis C-methylase UbiE